LIDHSESPYTRVFFSSSPCTTNQASLAIVSTPQDLYQLDKRSFSIGDDNLLDGAPLDKGSNLMELLRQSSDPWALMGQRLLNLPIPSPSSRARIRAQDTELLRASRSRAGVGFSVPVGSPDTQSPQRGNAVIATSPSATWPWNDAPEDYEAEVILDFDSPQLGLGQFATHSNVSFDIDEMRHATNGMDMEPEHFPFPFQDEEDYLPPSDPESFSSSSAELPPVQILKATAVAEVPAICDTEMGDTPGEGDRTICDIILEVLSRQNSEDDKLGYSTVPDSDHKDMRSLLPHPSSSKMQVTLVAGNHELELDGLNETLPSGALDLGTDHCAVPARREVPSLYARTRTGQSLFDTLQQTASVPDVCKPNLEDSNSNTEHTSEPLFLESDTITTIEDDNKLEPTDSQLLMYTHSDVQTAPAVDSVVSQPVEPMDSTTQLTRPSNTKINLDKKTERGDEVEHIYDGPCLFFDQEDDEG
jgi:hypothetical protein